MAVLARNDFMALPARNQRAGKHTSSALEGLGIFIKARFKQSMECGRFRGDETVINTFFEWPGLQRKHRLNMPRNSMPLVSIAMIVIFITIHFLCPHLANSWVVVLVHSPSPTLLLLLLSGMLLIGKRREGTPPLPDSLFAFLVLLQILRVGRLYTLGSCFIGWRC